MAKSLVPVRSKVDLFPSARRVRLTWIGLWCRGQVGTELQGSQRRIKDEAPRTHLTISFGGNRLSRDVFTHRLYMVIIFIIDQSPYTTIRFIKISETPENRRGKTFRSSTDIITFVTLNQKDLSSISQQYRFLVTLEIIFRLYWLSLIKYLRWVITLIKLQCPTLGVPRWYLSECPDLLLCWDVVLLSSF